MSRLALIGVTGAAVVVVAAGLIYAIAQQEGDDSTDSDGAPATSSAAPGDGAAGNGQSATPGSALPKRSPSSG